MFPGLNQLSLIPSLLRHPRASREEVVAFQNRQLRRLITHAYKHVPYFRRLFDRNGLKPQDIRTVADLASIPITSKKDLQLLPVEEIVARGLDPKRLIDHRTSGASGEPFTILRTWLEEHLLNALRRRAMHYYGLRMNDKHANIVLIRPTHPRDNQLPLRVLQAVGLYRTVKIDCLQNPEEILCELKRHCSDVVTGLAGVMARVAQVVTDDDQSLIRPRFVVVGGEVLTPLMRQKISEAFRAPVFDMYGSHEFNLLAWQCKETGEFHTCDDGMILEVLKDGRLAQPGERGEVVGTNLHSFAMPFIRYRLGDIVTQGPSTCPCGQPFSTIRAVQGRMIDYFPLPGGRLLHPYEIVGVMQEKAPWIREYQLIQECESCVVLLVVPYVRPSSRMLAKLRVPVAALLGEGVEFQVRFVSQITRDASGKFRVSRSLVSSQYNDVQWDDQHDNTRGKDEELPSRS